MHSLNQIYRTIWSEALNTWVAVSELVKSKGKRSGSSLLRTLNIASVNDATDDIHRHRFKFALLAASCLLTFQVQANPTGGNVVNGSASFNTSGNTLTVTNTPGAIIHWQDFSIQQNEITRFAQQSASSAVLNRVVGGNTSQILGALQSNGRVFLVNPNGVVFGAGATVDVAGLVATSLNLSDTDFLAGRHRFTSDPNAQAVSNAGNLNAQQGGEIWLIAPNVENSGVITAPDGEILLAAGSSVELVNSLDPNLRVNITAPAGDATNVGQLVASAGRLGLFGTVVRNSGNVSADSATLQGGKIVFRSSQRTELTGTARAQGVSGGEIKVLSDMQTGTVQVGGTLDASAPVSGDGGFIDTFSAHVQAADTAHITTAAANGNSGTWLIDPKDFTIAATGGDMTGAAIATALDTTSVIIQSVNGATEGNGDIFVNDSITKTVTGATTTLTLQAESSIIVASSIAISSTGGALNVVFNADSDGLNGGVISMASGSSITSNGGNITLGGGIAGNGTGNAVGNATYASGIDILGASINSGAGNITLNGQGYGVGGSNMGVYLHTGASLTTTTGNVTINGTGGGMTDMTAGSNRGVRISSASAITTGTGNIGITGQGGWDGDGVQVVGGSQVKSTSGGQITLSGTTGLGTGLDYGIYLTDGGTLVETGGNILFTGVSNSVAGADNKGIALYEVTTPLTTGPKISALGTGNITFNGTGGGGTTFSSGMTISGSEVTAADGTITLNGASGAATGTENRGVNLHNGAWVHATGLGSINMTGVAVNTATASFGSGVRVASGAIVQTASGAINITGSGTNGTGSNYGVLITDALSAVKSASGAVSITGSGWGTGIGNYGVYVDAGGTVGTNSTAKLLANRDIYINSALTNSTGGSLVLNADMNGTGVGTVTFGASGSIALSGGGRADLYYNPVSYSDAATKSDALTNPYTTKITGLYTAWMLVNDVGLETGGTLGLQAMSTNLAGNYALGTNINAAGTTIWNFNGTTYDGFAPIGNISTPFTGRFDGLGHTVDSLTINRPTTDYVGLFGRTQASTIKNVSLTNVNISGNSYVGSLVGWHQGTLAFSSNDTGSVTGTMDAASLSGNHIGGLVGMNYNFSTIDSSSAGSTVSGDNYVGGLAGTNQRSTISNSSASGTVTGTQFYAGGLVGDSYDSFISNSIASGNVGGVSYVGGLLGRNGYSSNVSNSNASGIVTGTQDVGGLVGFNAYSIDSSHATGNVSGTTNVGGLLGNNEWVYGTTGYYTAGAISNSYAATGTVTGVANVGGLVGRNTTTSNTVSTSNAGGNVTGNSNVGGLVGFSNGTINLSNASGSVIGNGTSITNLGGLVGFSAGGFGTSISNSFATGVSVAGVGASNVGGLVGTSYTDITNCYAAGVSVSGGSAIGGLVGSAAATVSGSYVSVGSVTGTSNYGGLVGSYTGTLTNSHYNINGVAINGANVVTVGGLYDDNTASFNSVGQYTDWLVNGNKSLNILNYTPPGSFSVGTGTYIISNAQGLKDMLGFADNSAYTFVLAADIDLTTLGGFYIPILASDFDGANFTISNFSLAQDNSNLGMFGKVTSLGSVSNLVVQNTTISSAGGDQIGGLAGANYGTITNSSVSAGVAGTVAVTGGTQVGGLVGFNDGAISNSSVSGIGGALTVAGTDFVGGLVGEHINGSITGSHVSAATVAGANSVGGLAGMSYFGSSITNSYVDSGAIAATGGHIGGLVGLESGTHTNSYFDIDNVTTNGGNNVTVGGLYNTGGVGQFNDWFNGGLLTPLVITNYASLASLGGGVYGISDQQGMKDMLGFAEDPTYNFSLTTGINLTGMSGYYVPKLAGDFNGNGLSISNLSLTLLNDDMGLFGSIASGSLVSNLNLVNVAVSGLTNVGAVAGSNFGNIDTVTVSGTPLTVSGTSNVGGMVGRNVSYGSVTTLGALTGGNISNSSVSSGTVAADGGDAGGLAGWSTGNITNSDVLNTAVSGSNNVGGLVGYNQGSTSYVSGFWSGIITGSTVTNGSVTGNGGIGSGGIGGLVGNNFEGEIVGSYVLNPNVDGGAADGVGGLVGNNSVGSWGFTLPAGSYSISASYVSGGTVVSTGNNAGGLVGYNFGAPIDASYADAVVVDGGISVGGLVGYDSGEGWGGRDRFDQ